MHKNTFGLLHSPIPTARNKLSRGNPKRQMMINYIDTGNVDNTILLPCPTRYPHAKGYDIASNALQSLHSVLINVRFIV